MMNETSRACTKCYGNPRKRSRLPKGRGIRKVFKQAKVIRNLCIEGQVGFHQAETREKLIRGRENDICRDRMVRNIASLKISKSSSPARTQYVC